MSTLEDRKFAEGAPVVGVWASPFFGGQPVPQMFREGMTVYEIVMAMPCLPEDFSDRGTVMINDAEVNRGAWHLVRPKGSTRLKPITVTFHYAPRGGKGGNTGKMIIAVVAMVALAVLTAGIANAGWAAAGLTAIGAESAAGLFAAGTIGAKILAGAVGVIGALAISALTRPPTSKKPQEDAGQSQEAASAEGNVLAANGTIPRVIGTRKIFPPLACEPYVDLIGDDEYVNVLMVLNGPHKIENIKISDNPIADEEAIEYQVREGWLDDEPQTLVNRIARTTANNIEIKGHKFGANSTQALERQDIPDLSCPTWQRVSTKESPDEVVMHLLWPGGLIYSNDPNAPLCAPIRIRIRKSGDTAWINLPEIHYYGTRKPTSIRAQVRLIWDSPDAPTAAGVKTYRGGWHHARTEVPAQTAAPAESAPNWVSDSYFYSGSGTKYTTNADDGVNGLQNISFDANGLPVGEFIDFIVGKGVVANSCNIWLDSGTFPKGMYEIEVMRGCTYAWQNVDLPSYSQGSVVYNMFKFSTATGTHYAPNTISGIGDTLALSRVISLWNENPLRASGFSVIAMRGKNKQIQQVSCDASGYVKDWDGSDWNTWTTTSRPAPHYRDILSGRQNPDPAPGALIDDDTLVEWRTRCIANDYTCDYIAEGARTEEVLDIVASCGYARPYWSDKWSVIQDYDRSSDPPIQVFTHRNMRNFKFAKGFPRLPDGLLISYRSDAENSRTQQVPVYRNGIPIADGRMEQATYEGLIEEAKVYQRGAFDLRQAELRGTFYSWESPVEAIVCRRGSLVAVQSDILTRFAGQARIVRTIVSGGNITAIQIDADLVMKNSGGVETIAEVSTVEDVADVGLTMACAIRRVTGETTIHALQNVEGMSDILTFTSPVANDTTSGGPRDPATIPEITSGCLVTIGPLGQEYRRMIISQMIPGPDMTFQMTAVDESPELWA